MKKLIGAVSAVALLVAAGGALAAGEFEAQEATGTIQQLDQEMGTLVLDTGESFELGEGVFVEGLMEGDEVRVTYEEQDGIWIATSVEPAFEQPADEFEAEPEDLEEPID